MTNKHGDRFEYYNQFHLSTKKGAITSFSYRLISLYSRRVQIKQEFSFEFQINLKRFCIYIVFLMAHQMYKVTWISIHINSKDNSDKRFLLASNFVIFIYLLPKRNVYQCRSSNKNRAEIKSMNTYFRNKFILPTFWSEF